MMDFVAAFATGLASVAALAVVRSAANRRLRFLALSVGLLTGCQTGLVVNRIRTGWGAGSGDPDRFLILSAGLLALAVVHFLYRENRDRRNADMHLRFYEVENPSSAVRPTGKKVAGGEQERRRSRRIRFLCESTVRNMTLGLSPKQAEVENISRTGLGLVGPEPASVGDEVEVALLGYVLRGVVVRCKRNAAGYSCGIELDPFLRGEELKELLWRGARGEECAVNEAAKAGGDLRSPQRGGRAARREREEEGGEAASARHRDGEACLGLHPPSRRGLRQAAG